VIVVVVVMLLVGSADTMAGVSKMSNAKRAPEIKVENIMNRR